MSRHIIHSTYDYIWMLQELVDDIGIMQGKIVRPMRIVNPEQDEYCGLIQVGADGETVSFILSH